MILSMLSLGTFAAFAFAIQSLSLELTEGSALPPSLIATISSLPIFVNTLALAASFLPFYCLIVLHLLCPDINIIPLSIKYNYLIKYITHTFVM